MFGLFLIILGVSFLIIGMFITMIIDLYSAREYISTKEGVVLSIILLLFIIVFCLAFTFGLQVILKR